jgi:hypothetical protein
MQKEAALVSFKTVPGHLPGETEKNEYPPPSPYHPI